jgi:hypothetical protein
VHPDHVLNHQAELTDIPDDAMKVKIQGVPVVGIRVGTGIQRQVEIPDRLCMVVEHIENDVIARLAPFVRR